MLNRTLKVMLLSYYIVTVRLKYMLLDGVLAQGIAKILSSSCIIVSELFEIITACSKGFRELTISNVILDTNQV